MKFFKQTLSTLLLTLSLSSFAAPEAIQSEIYMDLRDWQGISFLQTMVYEEEGIVANFDFDFTNTYKFANQKEAAYAIENFDRKNKNRILRMFNYDKKLYMQFAKKLLAQEKTFTPENVHFKVNNVMREMGIKGSMYSLGQFMALASGAGVLIRIDEDNYFYNIGYTAPEVKSGRSYGATTLHAANDASHLMYLGELDKFLKGEHDHRFFFTSLLKFLVDTDLSAYDDARLDVHGEAVLTDYITVYTAELRRHLMRNLSPYSAPWGNDMTEATFLSAFNVETGLMSLDEGIVEASIKEHWALSKTGSGRSGFGINRKPRRKLQAMISNFFRNHKKSSMRKIVTDIDKLIGKRRDGDVYRGLMEYLNNKKNLVDHTRVEKIEEAIVPVFVNFLMKANKHADEIIEAIQ